MTAVLALAVVSAAAHLPEVNTILNVLMLVVVLFGAPRYFRAKAAEAQLAEKDKAITTHEQTAAALTRRTETLETDVRECRELAEQACAESREWRARYEEQSKYTAEPALLEVRDSIKAAEATTTTSLSALGELVMKSNELLARLDPHR